MVVLTLSLQWVLLIIDPGIIVPKLFKGVPEALVSHHHSPSSTHQTRNVLYVSTLHQDSCSLLLPMSSADPIIDALDTTGAELPDRTAYEKDYKVRPRL